MVCVHNFTGVYELQSFYKAYSPILFDHRGLSGVRGYMEEEAKEVLKKQIRQEGKLRAIHFLDSGNYHHVSYLYACLIEDPFVLVVFDNHTDMQESAFGGILSCGSWIADVLRDSSFLRKIIIIGAKKEYVEECFYKEDDRVIFLDSFLEAEGLIGEFPVYLSIDKDVLSKEEFVSDWDQGTFSLKGLIKEITLIKNKHTIIGIDVCGEADHQDKHSVEESDRINEKILKVFLPFLDI